MTSIAKLKISRGSHRSIEEGANVLELASYLARGPWSDRPRCVSTPIRKLLSVQERVFDDSQLQKLKPYARRAVDTAASRVVENRRAMMCVDWFVREYLPTWLDVTGLRADARVLRAVKPLLVRADVHSALVSLQTLCASVITVVDRIKGLAKEPTVETVAWDVQQETVWDAIWRVPGSFAFRAKLLNVLGITTWNVVRLAVWDALTAAELPTTAAGYAKQHAAKKSLAPVVNVFQRSSLRLLDRMIAEE